MRTTVDIPNATYRRLKARAASEGTTVKALVLEAIEAVLTQPKRAPKKKLQLPLIHSREPGTLDLTNEQIYDLIDFP